MLTSFSQMNTLRMVISICFALGWANVIGFGQGASGPPPFGDAHVGGDVPFDERVAEATRRRFEPAPEDRVLKTGALAPSKEDRAMFEGFLRAPNTGLMRLLPFGSATYQPTIPNGGVHYSFANVTHFLVYGTDIELNGGLLATGYPGVAYGLLTNLGDVPLEQVELSDPRIRFLAAYQPAVTLREARSESLRFRSPVTVDGILYQNSLPAQVNSTYVVRSINYGKKVAASNAPSGPVSSGRATDVLVAFRVVRKDTDGSVIIAWKLLKKYSAPKLVRPQA